jgi:NADH/NAD ratio-sensing transcriptional regulator Rex
LSIGKAVLEVTLLNEVPNLVVVIFDVNFELVGSELVDVVILDNTSQHLFFRELKSTIFN